MPKKSNLLGLLLFCVMHFAAFATPVTFNFSGAANTDEFVDGNFNSAYPSGDTISGSLTFDDLLFSQLTGSYFAIQEYPDAKVSFAIMGGSTVQTKPVAETTGYDDLRLVTNLSASSLNWYNLSSSAGILNGAFMALFFHIDKEVNVLADIQGHVDQIEFVWDRFGVTNGLVHRYYTSIEFGSTSNDIPEPSSLALVGMAMLCAGVVVCRRKTIRQA